MFIRLNIKIRNKVHQKCSETKGVLRNFSKFTETLVPDLFLNKVAGLNRLRPATILKKRLWHRCFPVNFEKFLRTPLKEPFFLRLRFNSILFAPQANMLNENKLF